MAEQSNSWNDGSKVTLFALLACALLIGFVPCWGQTNADSEGFVQAKPNPGNPAPPFPEKAKQSLVAGDVVFQARLSPNGTVADVRILSVPAPDRGFEEAVRDTVRQWRFQPARNNGVSIAATYVGRIAFKLNADEEELRKLVVALVHRSAFDQVDDASMLFHPESGHTHTGGGWVRRSRPAASKLAELLKAHIDDPSTLSIQGCRYLVPEVVSVSATLRGTDESNHELNIYAVKASERWQVAHVSLEPMWQSIDRSRFEPPQKTRERHPEYPEQAKRAGIGGKVVVEAVTDRDGKVLDVVSLSEDAVLVQSLETAAKGWRYNPVKLDGEALSMYIIAEGTYTLNGEDGQIDIRESVEAPLP